MAFWRIYDGDPDGGDPDDGCYDDDYDYVDSEYDDKLRDTTWALTRPVFARVEALKVSITAEGEMPHPWTWERGLLYIWDDEGEDALDEHLEVHFRETAEEMLLAAARREADRAPCCINFDCPCGGRRSWGNP